MLDDDAALLLMARRILSGPTDAGVSSYQTALTVCERCRSGTVEGRGDAVPVQPDIVEMAACDTASFATSGEGTHVGHEASAEAVLRRGLAELTRPAKPACASGFGPKAA